MQSIVPPGYLVSLAWTGFKKNDTTLETLKLNVRQKSRAFQSQNATKQQLQFDICYCR